MTALVLLAFLAPDLPPQPRSAAGIVVVGKVEKYELKPRKWAGDGEKTTFTATVKVTKAEKGDAKAGDTLTVTWEGVTKVPSMPPLKYAHGQLHPIKAGDTARFWLVKPSVGPLVVIYNKDGIEKVKE